LKSGEMLGESLQSKIQSRMMLFDDFKAFEDIEKLEDMM